MVINRIMAQVTSVLMFVIGIVEAIRHLHEPTTAFIYVSLAWLAARGQMKDKA